MTTGTTELRNARTEGAGSTAWMVVAIGAGVGMGIASVVYRRSRRSRWDRVKHRASDLIEMARDEAKPWMGIAAGGAAAGTALVVYARSRRESGWERARRRTTEVASRVGREVPQWARVASTAAIALASVASSRKAQRRVIEGVSESAADTINSLTDRGLRLASRVRDIAEEARKLYPAVQRVIAQKTA